MLVLETNCWTLQSLVTFFLEIKTIVLCVDKVVWLENAFEMTISNQNFIIWIKDMFIVVT